MQSVCYRIDKAAEDRVLLEPGDDDRKWPFAHVAGAGRCLQSGDDRTHDVTSQTDLIDPKRPLCRWVTWVLRVAQCDSRARF